MDRALVSTDSYQLIYLYDLPRGIVTSVKISQVVKDLANYDLQEPVTFREYKPNPITGIRPLTCYGIIKVENSKLHSVASAIKYFEVTDGEGVKKWQCRALPYDKELLGSN